MAATLLDGKKVSEEIKLKIKRIINEKFLPNKFQVGLVAIMVGKDPASQVYIKSKIKACEEVGIFSKVIEMDSSTTESELLNIIQQLNVNPKYHGILVQQPLPKHINVYKINEAINPLKDVDGFHPINLGKVLLGEKTLVPCTPAGIMELLNYYKISTQGKNVVIVGRSNIVGKPLMALLIQKNEKANATVTLCHSKTKELANISNKADILIAAMGKAEFIRSNFVKEGAVVIDVGINRVEDKNSAKGYKLVGDVAFNEIFPIASCITPVPGGVGPMTIAMLLKNTIIASSTFYGIELNV